MTKSHLVSAILPLQSFAYIKGSYSASLKTLVHFCVYLDIMDGWIEGRRNENILFICIVYCGIGIYVSMYMCVCIYAYKYVCICGAGGVKDLFHHTEQLCALLRVNIK